MIRKQFLLAACLSIMLAGCSSSAASGNASDLAQSSAVSSGASLNASSDDLASSQTAGKSESAGASDGVGRRVRLSLDQAVLKKNQDEQFVLLYVKDDCDYCAEFDEVLNPYLQNHPLAIYEVSLSQAEQMYTDEDRLAMLDILSAGVDRTPALYYIESQEKVNLLDHTADNYSEDGLSQWVEKYDLERLK